MFSLSVSVLVVKAGLLCMSCGDGMKESPFVSSEVSRCVSIKSDTCVCWQVFGHLFGGIVCILLCGL